MLFGLVQMWKLGSIHPFYHCSQCWRKSLDVQIIGEPRAPADLVSWQGPNPQYIFSFFGHRFTGDPPVLRIKNPPGPWIWHFSPEKTAIPRPSNLWAAAANGNSISPRLTASVWREPSAIPQPINEDGAQELLEAALMSL